MSLSTFWARIQLGLSSEVTKASNRCREEMQRLAITPQPSATLSSMTEQSATTASSKQFGQSAPSALISETVSDEVPQPTASITIAVETSSSELEKTMSFTAILKALSLIPSILPVIAAFVQQADALLSGSPGTAKLQAVLAAVTAYLAKIEADADVIAELQKLVTPLIEGAVAFAHTASPPVVTTGAAAKA
jgi:hypothetical protein